MPQPHPLSPADVTILFYLRDEAADGCGWLRRGVRGWRLYGEIKAATGQYISERLPYLAWRGLLDRLDLTELGREKPTSLYRISEAGARRVAELAGTAYKPVPAPKDDGDIRGNLFVPSRAWAGLETLRRSAKQRVGPVRFGAHGWMTAAEVHEAHPLVKWKHLTWLVSRGLVESRTPAGPDEPNTRAHYYRITTTGLRAEPVDAVAGPADPLGLVELRVGEASGPTRPKMGPANGDHGSRRGPARVRRP